MSDTRRKAVGWRAKAAVDARWRRDSMRRLRSAEVKRRRVDQTAGEVLAELKEWHGDEPEQVGAADPVTGLGVGEELIEAEQMADKTTEDKMATSEMDDRRKARLIREIWEAQQDAAAAKRQAAAFQQALWHAVVRNNNLTGAMRFVISASDLANVSSNAGLTMKLDEGGNLCVDVQGRITAYGPPEAASTTTPDPNMPDHSAPAEAYGRLTTPETAGSPSFQLAVGMPTIGSLR